MCVFKSEARGSLFHFQVSKTSEMGVKCVASLNMGEGIVNKYVQKC